MASSSRDSDIDIIASSSPPPGAYRTPRSAAAPAPTAVMGPPPSSSSPISHSVDHTSLDRPDHPLDIEFQTWAGSPTHKNKYRLSHAQRRDFKRFLDNPRDKGLNPIETNRKYRALKHFQLVGNQLYRKPGDELEDADDLAAQQPRKVIMLEAAWTAISATHERILHTGITKTWGEVQRLYYGPNKEEVSWVVKNCVVCQQNNPSKTRAPLQAIKSSNVNERWCIDLIDMRDIPYGGMHWVYHSKEAVSKRSYIVPLPGKDAEYVFDALYYNVMAWGVPVIIQCDNGTEFKAVLLTFLRSIGIRIINGKPHKPTTQGLVEQGNATVESRLRAWMKDNESDNWPMGCLHVALTIDITLHSCMNIRPFQVMMGGRMPNLTDDNWLNIEDRQTATVQNENGDHNEDEGNLDFQARMEFYNETYTSPRRLPSDIVEEGPSRAPHIPLLNLDFGVAARRIGKTQTPRADALVRSGAVPAQPVRPVPRARKDPSIPSSSIASRTAISQAKRAIGSSKNTQPLTSPQTDLSQSSAPSTFIDLTSQAPSFETASTNETASTSTHETAPTQETAPSGKSGAIQNLLTLCARKNDPDLVQISQQLLAEMEKSRTKSPPKALPSQQTARNDTNGDSSSELSENSPPESDEELSDRDNTHAEASNSGRSKLTNRPPGAPRDFHTDPIVLKARTRQEASRRKMTERYNKKYCAEVFDVGTIVTVKIPKKDRPSGLGEKRLYARVIHRRRQTYQLQTDFGVLNRYTHISDLAAVPPALARLTQIRDNPRQITLRKAARKSSHSNSGLVRISCRCKGACETNLCTCKKHNKKCSIYCHPSSEICSRRAEGSAFTEYALIPYTTDEEMVDVE